MDLSEQLAIVEGALQKLIRDWERFFAGDLRVPPHGERERLARRLRLLAEDQDGSRAERFRLEQLQHRFMTYAGNWERMLREREEGRGRSVAAVRAATSSPNVTGAASVDDATDADLYDRYVAAKSEHGAEVAVDREAFDAQIERQRNKLRSKLGRHVEFDVVVEDGKVRLAARRKKAR
jgi:hypothetical protein